jgi:hypothetical protein
MRDRIENKDSVVVASQSAAAVLLIVQDKSKPDYAGVFLTPAEAREVAQLLTTSADAADATMTPEARAASFEVVADFMRENGATAREIAVRRVDILGDDMRAAHELPTPDGPVSLSLEDGDKITVLERFATIADAESFLGLSASVDPDHLHAGHYGIDAPLGLGSDEEAIPTARRLGLKASTPAEALAKLAKVDPDGGPLDGSAEAEREARFR